ncbi:hypothetical protein [Pseudovibrio sp. Tun.PSC04-5.I4]|uniref:hypothetical protein n=1 Tax=Pseudovibrio sp. Tun.PSC04-5.I4 TaxID=1798213 RepID=UPI000889887D|nr:hypothetical protein [Pseudovibrio sp. Tun.PSC04-5.I4]SDQ32738.1 hypothetical protein SAMN04515695_0860 [Pseudovibrio sp. Tun.PSC04-5.I4]
MSVYKNSLKYLAILSLFGALSACVVPEQYEAELSIYGDQLSVEFEGTLKELVSVMSSGGRPIAPDDPQLQELLSDLAADFEKQPGYTSVQITDNNRIYVKLSDTREISDIGYIYGLPATQRPKSKDNFLRIEHRSDGEILITSAKFKAKDLAALLGSDYDPDGVISISTDHEVLEHNADETPGLLSSSYVWNVDSEDALLKGVKMRLKMN